MEKAPKITKGCIIRTVMTLIVVVNMILKAFGVQLIDVSESAVASVVETGVSVAAIIASWWYNNSMTENARQADRFLKELNRSDVG